MKQEAEEAQRKEIEGGEQPVAQEKVGKLHLHQRQVQQETGVRTTREGIGLMPISLIADG